MGFLWSFVLSLLLQEAFTRVFCQHYQKIAKALVSTSGARKVEQLSNRVVHVSVQLFSNKQLVEKMVQEQNLLYVMVKVLHDMVRPTLEPCKAAGMAGLKIGKNVGLAFCNFLAKYCNLLFFKLPKIEPFTIKEIHELYVWGDCPGEGSLEKDC